MANQNININADQYEKYLIEEGEKIDSYMTNYYTKFKIPKPAPPTKEELSFWNIAGLESSIFVLSGLGAATLSAVRTGGLFFLMEVLLVKKYGLPPILGSSAGIIALVSSLLAFEGTLIGIGLVKGRESGKIKISTTSLIVSLSTVILASIFSSFSIVSISLDNQLYMDITLALVTGIAASITAYLSFENVGFIRNDVNKKREDIKTSFSHNYKAWEEGAIASYNSTRKNITNRVTGNNYYVPVSDVPETPTEKISKVEAAYRIIVKYYEQNRTIPTNKFISETMGIPVGGTSAKAIATFITRNENDLLSKGVVTPEQVLKAHTSLGQTVTQDPSPDKKITQFIQQKGLFPTSEELKEMDIPLENTVLFIVQNQDSIRENKWLSEDIIREATERYNKN